MERPTMNEAYSGSLRDASSLHFREQNHEDAAQESADATITFHRPKEGLLTRTGKALSGRVLVAPIGIPAAADPL